jgi:hypothetical protein
LHLLHDLAFVPAGEGDQGGATGVIRELIVLNSIAATVLGPSGKPRYGIAALFDNDDAGRYAVRSASKLDVRLTEYKNMFLLRPAMPETTNRDPSAMHALLEGANAPFRGLNWELEDLFPESFMKAFRESEPSAVARTTTAGGKTHRDLTRDGKARFHRFVREQAMLADLAGVVETIKAIRSYVGLPNPTSS